MRNLEPSRKVTLSQGFKSLRIHVFGIFTFLQKWLKGFGPPLFLSCPHFARKRQADAVGPSRIPVGGIQPGLLRGFGLRV